jgi:photosystem II stability/assembly factor-like uncharacterized protein
LACPWFVARKHCDHPPKRYIEAPDYEFGMMKSYLLKYVSPALLILLAIFAIAPQGDLKPPAMLVAEREDEGDMQAPADHFFDVRSYPDGKFDLAAYEAALDASNQVAQAKVTAGISSVPWRLEGPTNIGGRINCMAIDPNNPAVMLVGSAVGGIYKTTDGGTSWNPVFDGHNFLAIGALTYEPGSSMVVYAGTGDPNISGYPFLGDGIYKSVDGGLSWTYLGLSNARIVSKIVIDPSNHNKIFVATMGLPMARNLDRGLYVSLNGGTTWTQSLFVADQAGIIDLVINPSNPQILYASSWDRIRTANESVAKGPNAKIWKTANGGITWSQLSNGLPSGPQSRINLAIHPTNPAIVYAAIVDSTYQLGGIYKTVNSGGTWTQLGETGLDSTALGGFGWYFGKIYIDPYQPTHLWLLGVQAWRTVDDGAFWERRDPLWYLYQVHADKHDMVFTGPGEFYLCTDGGLYKTPDDGDTWTDEENIPNNMVYRVAINPHEADNYAAGLQDNGTVTGNWAAPNNWFRAGGGDGFQAIYDNDPAHMVMEYQNGGIYYTNDGGQTTNDFTFGITYEDRRNWDTPVIISHFNPLVYYTGTYLIYRNADDFNFHLWVPISGDLTDGPGTNPRFHTITAIAESPIAEQLLYVGTSDGNVHRSTNTGATWTNISAGIPDRYVTSIKASPHDFNEVLVTVSGYRANDFFPHVLRSTDQGNTWVSVAGDLPQLALNDVLFHPSIDSIWVAASDNGVYVTRNFGQHWQRIGSNMPSIPVYDMEWDEGSRRLVAGTHGRSVMSFPTDSLEDQVISSVVDANLLPKLTLYPNPAHGSVHMQAAQAIGTWRVVDAQGRVLRGGEQWSSGNAIDLSGLPAGMYFVQAQIRMQTVTKRLVIE